jgi:hypothetical protein
MKQELGIAYGTNKVQEWIRYSPGKLPDGRIPPVTDLRVKWVSVENQLAHLRTTIKSIVESACLGHSRGGWAVEGLMAELAQLVLPHGCFAGLMAPHMNPVIDPDEQMSAIPWEMFEERFFQCPKNLEHVELAPPREADPPVVAGGGTDAAPEDYFCRRDGAKMVPVVSTLGIRRTVSYSVRPYDPPVKPEGNCFLLILDPLGDLCSPDNDPQRLCNAYIRDLEQLLRGHFELVTLREATATFEMVRDQLRRRDLAGIYYFGHGLNESGEGSLVLDNRRQLFTDAIRAARPTAPLVFINACWGADIGATAWDEKKKLDSVAHAFAQGPAKTVIGSLWPVVNTQAAAYALQFFEALFRQRMTVGDALRAVRVKSLAAYNDKQPDTAWMSYRLFGDAERRMLEAPVALLAETCPLFTAEGLLDFHAFSFPIEDVVWWAFKRRNFQRRGHVAVEDVAAGLLRKATLLRLLCRLSDADPDQLYSRLRSVNVGPVDPRPVAAGGLPPDPVGAKPRQLSIEDLLDPQLWLVQKQGEFEPALLGWLTEAAQRARAAGGPEAHVSERDLIEVCLGDPAAAQWWPRLSPHLPPAEKIRAALERVVGQQVDNDGGLLLTDLDPDASHIVVSAHAMAQQRGMHPIPTRLLTAAFLADSDRVAWNACMRLGIDPAAIRKLMIALTEAKKPRTFVLGHEACERVILPTLQRARELAAAAGAAKVGEALLFQAFVEVASPHFKKAMRKPPLPFDLDAVARAATSASSQPAATDALPPAMPEPHEAAQPAPAAPHAGNGAAKRASQGGANGRMSVFRKYFQPGAWRVLAEAAQWAHVQGSSTVDTPHLFAALIGDGATPVGDALRSQNADPERIKQLVLNLRRTHAAASQASSPGISENVAAVLERARRIARQQGRDAATAEDLTVAFFADGGGAVGELLIQEGLHPPLLPPGA